MLQDDDLRPPLDPGFVPIALWSAEFAAGARAAGAELLTLALEQPGGCCFHSRLELLPGAAPRARVRNLRRVERQLKHLLWAQGGHRVTLASEGPLAAELAAELARLYAPGGERAFDEELVGRRIHLAPLTITACAPDALPPARVQAIALGRHLEGCRVGFDLGGSDRKAAAVVDGEVVFSEEIAWSPYFETDPRYHYEGIRDSIARAAARLPRLDAIGGSAAGVYVDGEPRVASLFRGVSRDDFAAHVRPMFRRLQAEFGGVPFELVNDGEVTALAASMQRGHGRILGISMGTSLAAGYVDGEGHITSWLDELAFCPVDVQDAAPADEWSGDLGCGVQYFSQQAVARLAPRAGIDLPADMPLPERLSEVQRRLQRGDAAAERIFVTIGRYLGWTLPFWAETYVLEHVLILGRVTSGAGGERILEEAQRVLEQRFPALAERIGWSTPDEQLKRHGQAIAAASLPALRPR